jgi:hypothetical protein
VQNATVLRHSMLRLYGLYGCVTFFHNYPVKGKLWDFKADGIALSVVTEFLHRNTRLRQLLTPHDRKLFGPGQNVASFLDSRPITGDTHVDL